jgi:hypothetical protein
MFSLLLDSEQLRRATLSRCVIGGRVPQVRNDHVVDAGNGSGRFRPNRTFHAPMPDLSVGEVRIRVDRVGLSANSVTYAVLSQPVRYWHFSRPSRAQRCASSANNLPALEAALSLHHGV